MSTRNWLATVDRRDGLLLAGFGSFIYGIAQLSGPAAWMTAGALLLAAWAAPWVLVRKRGQ